MNGVFQMMLGVLTACLMLAAPPALSEPMKVLWLDVSEEERALGSSHRERVARFMNDHDGGAKFDVTYSFDRRGGALARHLEAQGDYRIIVIIAAHRRSILNNADVAALQGFYANGTKAMMLDGTFLIRNTNANRLSNWPGVNASSAHLTINQLEALRDAGGGLLIGTDHDVYQTAANKALRAILPEARFTRNIDPSRDGEFFGELLLAYKEQIKPIDILRHWESIPSQGQAPVGSFSDFAGQQVMLYTLVEAADKPGGGTRRTYISATFDPGDKRYDIAEDTAPVIDRMPTRKSLPAE